jgi:hypothetical protein
MKTWFPQGTYLSKEPRKVQTKWRSLCLRFAFIVCCAICNTVSMASLKGVIFRVNFDDCIITPRKPASSTSVECNYQAIQDGLPLNRLAKILRLSPHRWTCTPARFSCDLVSAVVHFVEMHICGFFLNNLFLGSLFSRNRGIGQGTD